MIPIRHLLAIVFLWCGLITQGRAKVYDHFDMVGTYKYENSEYILNLHLHTDDTFIDYITLNVPPRAFSNVPLQIWSL